MTPAAEKLVNMHNRSSLAYLDLTRKPAPIGPESRKELYPTDTSLAQEYIWDIMTGLSGNVTYGPAELRQLFESGYHPAFFGKESPPNNNVLTAKATYVLPRLVATEHIPLLADAEIHFTDNAREFYQQDNGKNIRTFIPDKRARV